MTSKGKGVADLASQMSGKSKSNNSGRNTSRQNLKSQAAMNKSVNNSVHESDDEEDDDSFDEEEEEDGIDDGEDEDDEDDDDEDDEEEEEEEEEDDEEEEESAEDKGGFDEKFLAQLMAMDPMFSNKAVQDNRPVQLGNVRSTSVTTNPISDQTQIISQGTPFPNMPAYASAASTPSNEFYDGAINFLTEVLGSSDTSLWNASDTNQGNPTAAGWTHDQQKNITAAASPAPTQAQFKNLQPLISNLIARLKGQPVEESDQGPRVLEEDLVVLLQSLMAQRQAQEERKSIRQPNREQSATVASTTKQQNLSSQTTQQSKNANQNIAQQNIEFPTMDEVNALIGNGSGSNLTNSNLAQQSAPGFSIVDFDFGEDDDDPDFVPGNFSLQNSFGGDPSQSFTQALTGNKGNLDQQVNDAAWQQMISTLGNMNSVAPLSAATTSGIQMSPGSGEARRTRSTSKNMDSTSLHSKALKNFEGKQPSTISQDDESVDDVSSSLREGDESKTRARKRKTYSAEEALQRRREANRECARRQRARKKEETETIRREIERIQSMGPNGAQMASDSIIDVTQALVGRRSRGRPLGSKNRKTLEEEKQLSEELADETGMADLRAENRMLRAEMYRLREENAKFRAKLIRNEEILYEIGRNDLIGNRRRGGREGHGSSDEDGNDSISDQSDDERNSPIQLEHANDPAAGFLAYQPFRAFGKRFGRSHESQIAKPSKRTSSSSKQNPRVSSALGKRGRIDDHPSQSHPNNRNSSSSRNQGHHPRSHHQNNQIPSSNNALQDLLRAAADEMGGYDYT